MKTHIQYDCSFCDFSSDFAYKTMEHEASHYGLSFDDYCTWKNLHKNAAKAGRICTNNMNIRTDTLYTDACRALNDFERQHNLLNRQPPSDFLT